MIRTQISLSENDYKLAKLEAANLGISLAEFFRRSLSDALPASSESPWMRYSGFVESGDKNSSKNIDEIVYGSKV